MNEGHVCCRNIAIIKVKEFVSETSKYGVTFKLRLGGVKKKLRSFLLLLHWPSGEYRMTGERIMLAGQIPEVQVE